MRLSAKMKDYLPGGSAHGISDDGVSVVRGRLDRIFLLRHRFGGDRGAARTERGRSGESPYQAGKDFSPPQREDGVLSARFDDPVSRRESLGVRNRSGFRGRSRGRSF